MKNLKKNPFEIICYFFIVLFAKYIFHDTDRNPIGKSLFSRSD